MKRPFANWLVTGSDYMLGINTVYLSVDDTIDRGFDRVEVTPSPIGDKMKRQKKMTDGIEYTNSKNFPFSIHLPVYVFDWFKARDLDAFFLDEDDEKSNMSLELLRENLKKLSDCGVDYVVTHFSGAYRDAVRSKKVDEKARRIFLEIQEMANKYNIYVCAEYMGGNSSFYHPEQWLEATRELDDVGILLDTGHLYFSTQIHGLDLDENFELLRNHARAFHFWNIFGEGAYNTCDAYMKYHHIVPRLHQTRQDGWAYDAQDVFTRMHRTGRPIVIEATQRYNGIEYFEEGIDELLALNSALNQKL